MDEYEWGTIQMRDFFNHIIMGTFSNLIWERDVVEWYLRKKAYCQQFPII
jgi:hypothetical protein